MKRLKESVKKKQQQVIKRLKSPKASPKDHYKSNGVVSNNNNNNDNENRDSEEIQLDDNSIQTESDLEVNILQKSYHSAYTDAIEHIVEDVIGVEDVVTNWGEEGSDLFKIIVNEDEDKEKNSEDENEEDDLRLLRPESGVVSMEPLKCSFQKSVSCLNERSFWNFVHTELTFTCSKSTIEKLVNNKKLNKS